MNQPAPIDPCVRERRVRRVVFAILWLNLAVAIAKAVYAHWSGSLAVAADALHSFLDAGANVIGLIALRLAHQPPDAEHPYGHRKFEIVAAASIGVLVSAGAFEFGTGAVGALIEGRPSLETPPAGFVVIGGTWLINIFVAVYEGRAARRYDSPLLAADAGHTASDVVVTTAVLVALVAGRFGIGWADPAAALFVLAVVAKVAWSILAGNVGVLVDRAVVDPARVRELVLATPGARGCHRVRSRGTSVAAHLDLHVLMDPELPLRTAHEIAHHVEDRLRAELPEVVDVTIHIEPEGDPPEGL